MIEQDPVNALTVDVEDYYHVESFADVIPRDHWAGWTPRIERNTDQLLSLFDDFGVFGTFFILGWVADRNPGLVRRIADAGHEIACHSFDHRLIQNQTPAEFRQDLVRAKGVIEDLSGQKVIGYRAPTYSINARTRWALDILIEEGFQYDSSIFPIYHDRYGIPGAERFPHLIRTSAGDIIEFPPSTVRVAGHNIPLAGGGYFRLLPYSFFSWGVRRINQVEQKPAIFMVHAWEVDEDQPRIPGSWLNVWRHRRNLDRTWPRLQQLLKDFNFAPLRDMMRHANVTLIQQEDLYATVNPAYARMD